MNIVIIILCILGGLIALLLIIAVFAKKGYTTHREIIIQAPRQKVFDYLKQVRNQENFNKWVMADPAMKKELKGTDGTVGFIYAWNGNKQAGEGEQEIKAITEGKSIDAEIRFIRPFAGVARAKMMTESLSDTQTKATWNTTSEIKYPLNLMLPMIVKMLEKDMGASLTTLKSILEK